MVTEKSEGKRGEFGYQLVGKDCPKNYNGEECPMAELDQSLNSGQIDFNKLWEREKPTTLATSSGEVEIRPGVLDGQAPTSTKLALETSCKNCQLRGRFYRYDEESNDRTPVPVRKNSFFSYNEALRIEGMNTDQLAGVIEKSPELIVRIGHELWRTGRREEFGGILQRIQFMNEPATQMWGTTDKNGKSTEAVAVAAILYKDGAEDQDIINFFKDIYLLSLRQTNDMKGITQTEVEVELSAQMQASVVALVGRLKSPLIS